MLTDQEIRALTAMRKTIQRREPVRGYRDEGFQRRCNVELISAGPSGEQFEVFMRQNLTFMDNFSIGLRYRTGDPTLGMITLAWYNGPQGEQARQPDGHYALPHIHRITEAELVTGNRQPQESHREITDRYLTFEDALIVFFQDVHVMNHQDHFPISWRLFP